MKCFYPTEDDLEYIQENQLKISLICRIDSYKFSHPFAYPENIQAMTSYGEARVSTDTVIVPFGMQLLIKKYLSETITMKDVDDAEAFALDHFGRPLFARKEWEKVVEVYGGKLPLIIRAVPEGTVMHGGLPIYTVTVFDEDLFWMSAGFETLIQRAIWYPTTIASQDYVTKKKLKEYYEETGADLNMLPFALHDFGGRGVTSPESAEIGGAAHLVNFMGSDTVEGILTANFYYNHDMAGFSVYATEHSIQCCYNSTEEGQIEYLRHQLKNAEEGQIISIVIDGYDVFREAKSLCTTMREEIIQSKAKVVFRPDSGDMLRIVPILLKMQADCFGYDLTEKGYQKIRHVGLIQGDGISHKTLFDLLDVVVANGFSADCLIFGSGGALLQKVNRDTFKFAQKACAILRDEKWIGIAKDPVTDHGKKSKEGVLTTVRYLPTGGLRAVDLSTTKIRDDEEDIMKLVYHTGTLYNEDTLENIRKRVEI